MLMQVCQDADFDATSATCSAPQWVEYAGGLPPLSAVDGMQISMAIVGCWAIGFIVKAIRAALKRGG